MFAAGNDARNALRLLMEVGGQEALSLQDNRGNNVTKYACGEETKRMVESRWAARRLDLEISKNQDGASGWSGLCGRLNV